jgi:hypothetical protein
MLMPAAVLVVIVLGALAVDQSIAFLAQREVTDATTAAANDAAGAVDEARFRESGDVRIDCGLAAALGQSSLEARAPEWLLEPRLEVVDCAADHVRIRVSADAATVFAKALPGGRRRVHVETTVTATAVRG